MAGAWGQRQADGTAPRMADGTTPRTTVDTVCCCGGLDCPYCDGPVPTAYDFEFTGVTPCTGEPALYAHTVTLDTYVLTSGPSCHWDTVPYDSPTERWEVEAALGVVFGTQAMGVNYNRITISGGIPTLHRFFQGEMSPYGPDCSATVLVTNDFTTCTASAAKDGSAAGVAVMPP